MTYTFERGGDIHQHTPHATNNDGEYYPMSFNKAIQILDLLVNHHSQGDGFSFDAFTKSEINAAWELIYVDVVEDF